MDGNTVNRKGPLIDRSPPAMRERSPLPPITIIATALNERAHVEAWVESVRFADRVIVGDQGSRDGTADALRSAGVEVVDIPPGEIIEDARQRIVERVPDGWVFVVDLDERVPDALQAELPSRLAIEFDAVAFRVPFRHYVFGRWLRHGGWNDAHLRIFRAGKGRYLPGRIHAQPEIDGPIATLDAFVAHFAHTSLHEFVVKMNRYTSQSASALASGEAAGLRKRPMLPAKPLRWLRASGGVFWNRYVKARGFRDGTAGFVIAVMLSAYQFVEQAKAWEAREGVA